LRGCFLALNGFALRQFPAFALVMVAMARVVPAGVFPARLVTPRLIATRFVPAGLVTPRRTRLLMRLRQGLRLARGLDAAERPTQFFDLAFIGQFLAFGDFNEFQDFIEFVNHLLERLGNASGQLHRMTYGGDVGGAKISGLDPGFWRRRWRGRVLRFLAAVWPTV